MDLVFPNMTKLLQATCQDKNPSMEEESPLITERWKKKKSSIPPILVLIK